MDTFIFHSQFSIWIRYVYGFFKLSTYFRHGIPVSCNHSRGTASWVLKTACHPFWNRYFIGNLFLRLCEQSIPQKSVWPCGTEYRAGSRTVQTQEAFIPLFASLQINGCAAVSTVRGAPGAPEMVRYFFCLENTNICAIMNTRTLRHNSVSLARFSALTGHEQNKCCKKRENSV